MPRAKKRKKPFYAKVGDAIVEMKIIDLDRDGDGYPTVHWLIAEHMLREFRQHDRNKMMYGTDNWPARVQMIFDKALNYVESELKTPIYRMRQGKRLVVVTTDPDYREAKKNDFLRDKGDLETKGKKVVTRIREKHPDKLQQLVTDTQRLLT